MKTFGNILSVLGLLGLIVLLFGAWSLVFLFITLMFVSP